MSKPEDTDAWLADEQAEDDVLDDDEMSEEEQVLLVDDEREWAFPIEASRHLAALRAIEIAREERALRRALEDFPYDWSNGEGQTNHGEH